MKLFSYSASKTHAALILFSCMFVLYLTITVSQPLLLLVDLYDDAFMSQMQSMYRLTLRVSPETFGQPE